MFSKKQSKVKLSNSTVVAWSLTNKILDFLIEGREVNVRHANLKFANRGSRSKILLPQGNFTLFKEQLEVEVQISFQYLFTSLNLSIKLILEGKGLGWGILYGSEIVIKDYGDKKIFGLIAEKNDSFTPASHLDEEIIKNIRKTFNQFVLVKKFNFEDTK